MRCWSWRVIDHLTQQNFSLSWVREVPVRNTTGPNLVSVIVVVVVVVVVAAATAAAATTTVCFFALIIYAYLCLITPLPYLPSAMFGVLMPPPARTSSCSDDIIVSHVSSQSCNRYHHRLVISDMPEEESTSAASTTDSRKSPNHLRMQEVAGARARLEEDIKRFDRFSIPFFLSPVDPSVRLIWTRLTCTT